MQRKFYWMRFSATDKPTTGGARVANMMMSSSTRTVTPAGGESTFGGTVRQQNEDAPREADGYFRGGTVRQRAEFDRVSFNILQGSGAAGAISFWVKPGDADDTAQQWNSKDDALAGVRDSREFDEWARDAHVVLTSIDID